MIADLASLDFIDSTGLSVLIAAQRRLHERGGELVLKDPNSRVTKVLEITALTKVRKAHDSAGEAGPRSPPGRW